MKRLQSIWLAAVAWFEQGDLVPLMIAVSAAHYSSILAKYDYAIIAVFIGALVDLGHYRVVRMAVNYRGDDLRERAFRWIIAAVMTVISLGYSQRFYDDWLLSAPIPVLIATLAWLQARDKRQPVRPVQPDLPASAIVNASAMLRDAPAPQPVIIDAPVDAIVCTQCGALCKGKNAYAAHVRWKHPQVKA